MIGSLFSGIGGLDLGLERAGLGPVAWQAETNPFCSAGASPPRPGDVDGWRAWLAGGGPEPLLRGGVDGDPDWVDRVASLGNAVVPMVAEMVGRAIVAA